MLVGIKNSMLQQEFLNQIGTMMVQQT